MLPEIILLEESAKKKNKRKKIYVNVNEFNEFNEFKSTEEQFNKVTAKLSGLTHFWGTKNPLKMMENALFILFKSYFRSQDIQIFYLDFLVMLIKEDTLLRNCDLDHITSSIIFESSIIAIFALGNAPFIPVWF